MCAVQLGTFPFDNVEHSDADTDAAHRELWRQQMENSWKNRPHIRNMVGQVRPARETGARLLIVHRTANVATALKYVCTHNAYMCCC